MKSSYMICALLGVTMSLFVLANGAAQSSTGSHTTTSSPSNIAEPPKNANTSVINNRNESNATTALPLINIIVSTAATSASTSTSTTPAANTSTSNATTSTTSSSTTITSTTTPASTTKTTEKTSTTTIIPTTSTNASTLITTTAQSQTTAIPIPSPSKDRHFDGLSFFGGIILATCLMAIAVFSWKFYRQCTEGNYRTL